MLNSRSKFNVSIATLAVTRIEDTQVVMESLAKLSLIPKDVIEAWLTAIRRISDKHQLRTVGKYIIYGTVDPIFTARRVSPPYEKTSISKNLQ
jgi:hypothetical protein